MTGVPLSYQPEAGAHRCGNSFQHTFVVTGELPGRNGFGADLKRSLPRVAQVPSGSWWSTRSAAEGQFRQQVLTRLAYTQDELREHAASLSNAQENAVRWLFDLARGNLERVDALYSYWHGTGDHPVTGERLPVDANAPSPVGTGTYARASEWPLEESDAIYEYMPECAGKNAAWVEDRELILGSVRYVRMYFCPGAQTREQRAIDRLQILELLLDAARAVRCAQYGIWRIVLYRRALAQWNERYGDLPTFQAGGGSAQPRPGTQAGGGLTIGDTDPRDPRPGSGGGSPWQGGGVQPHDGGPVLPLPQAPADWPAPDPDDLPDPGPLGEGGPGGGTQTDPEPGSLLPRLPTGVLPLVVAGGAVAAYLFLQNTR